MSDNKITYGQWEYNPVTMRPTPGNPPKLVIDPFHPHHIIGVSGDWVWVVNNEAKLVKYPVDQCKEYKS